MSEDERDEAILSYWRRSAFMGRLKQMGIADLQQRRNAASTMDQAALRSFFRPQAALRSLFGPQSEAEQHSTLIASLPESVRTMSTEMPQITAAMAALAAVEAAAQKENADGFLLARQQSMNLPTTAKLPEVRAAEAAACEKKTPAAVTKCVEHMLKELEKPEKAAKKASTAKRTAAEVAAATVRAQSLGLPEIQPRSTTEGDFVLKMMDVVLKMVDFV